MIIKIILKIQINSNKPDWSCFCLGGEVLIINNRKKWHFVGNKSNTKEDPITRVRLVVNTLWKSKNFCETEPEKIKE